MLKKGWYHLCPSDSPKLKLKCSIVSIFLLHCKLSSNISGKTTCHLHIQLPLMRPPRPRPRWQPKREKCVINDRGLVISAGWLTDPTTGRHRSQSTPSLISTHYYRGHTSHRKPLPPQIFSFRGTRPQNEVKIQWGLFKPTWMQASFLLCYTLLFVFVDYHFPESRFWWKWMKIWQQVRRHRRCA